MCVCVDIVERACVFEYGGLEDREKKGVFCGGRIVTERLFFLCETKFSCIHILIHICIVRV